MVMPDNSRYVYVYLPTAEDKQRWQSLADNAGVPLSKFVIGLVENALVEESDFKPRGELVKEIGKLRTENKELRDDLKQKKIVLEKYENELKRFRNEAFVEDKFDVVRKYNKEIKAILKRSGVVDSYRLLEELGIDPKETDLVRAISKQLEELESFGMIASTQRGWRVDWLIMAASSTSSKVTPTELISEFREDSITRGLTQETARRYLSSLGIFNQYLEENGRDILEVDRDTLRSFINYLRVDREVSQRTIETYFAAMASFFGYLEYERYIDKNPVLEVRKRYLRKYKDNDDGQVRKLISVEDMTMLINSTVDVRDRTIIALLAKTGIRRNELIKLDTDDIDWIEQSLRLKPTAKRTNRTVFFDDETAIILHRWIRSSEDTRKKFKIKALFISNKGGRLNRNGVYLAVTRPAEKVGLHNPNSDRMEDHFSPHCCRHWFTTHLRRAGMPREFIQELRGDVRREAIDIYDHIDKKELRESYLAHVPQLGI